MKRLFLFLLFLFVALNCFGQFANTNGNKFPYTNGLNRQDVFIVGTPGVTNKNIAASNVLQSVSALNTASLPTFTNGSAVFGYKNVLLGSNVVSSLNLISNSFIAGNDMGANFSSLNECIWIGMTPNSGGMQGPGAIVIGAGAGGYPYSVVIGNQSDCFSYYSESIGVTGGINDSTNAINFGYGSAWDSKSSVHVFGSAYTDSDVVARTSYYGTKSGIATLPTTTNHVFQGKITADGSGITNLNADNISSGTVGSSRGGAGTVNGVLKANGSGTVSAAAAADVYGLWSGTGTFMTRFGTNANSTGSPAGSDKNVQYNASGSFGGENALSYDASADTLTGSNAFFQSITSPLFNVTTLNSTNFYVWNSGGTNYSSLATAATANRTVTLPDATGYALLSVANDLTNNTRFGKTIQQLASTGNSTNYTIDFTTTNCQTILATGNVYFSSITFPASGVWQKNLFITNVFKASSNITVYVQTNLLWLGNTNYYAIGASPMTTNRAYPVTNVLMLSLETWGTTPQSTTAYAIPSAP